MIQNWIDARRRHRLSHAHVQMARELGMNPKTLGKLDNHKQERWKAPLPDFIESLYWKRFGKERPDVVLSIEEISQRYLEKKAKKRELRLQRRAEKTSEASIQPAKETTPDDASH